ncbi:MAG: hypothetical protein N2Z74_09970 [Syntrophales bacterium]|nr:hypothetical protein [Syntrophales bacterium]
MIAVRLNMNSPVAEIFNFKTCCGVRVFDANLEILVENRSSRPAVLMSRFDLMGDYGQRHFANVLPPGLLPLAPGEVKALYCCMDEELWRRSHCLTLYDEGGNPLTVTIDHAPSLSVATVTNTTKE